MGNKEIVRRFYEEVFNAWDTSKLDEYMLDTYRQHNRVHAKPPCLCETISDIREDIEYPETCSEQVVDHVCKEIRVLEIG
jgi:hypothetical protein